MKGALKLAIVPGNTIADLVEKGLGARLEGYYNPGGFFAQVFLLSPFEQKAYQAFGLHVVPTRDVELPSVLQRLDIDLVRAYGGNTPADMAVFHRAKDVPVIVSIHDKRPSMVRRAVRFADVVFVLSEELRGIVRRMGVAPERIMLVPNGVDEQMMRPLAAGERADLAARYPFKYKLLHVGRRSPEKNIEGLLRMLAALGPDYGLVDVGQGDAGTYRDLAGKAGVAGRCIFVDGVPQEDLPRFYNWADCVCHPSFSEAMCNVLLEALACGRPVVASTTAAIGLGEVPQGAMLLVEDPLDHSSLAGQVRRACEDALVRQQLCAGARDSVRHLFLKEAQAHEAACYRKVLEMKAAGVFRRTWLDDAYLWLEDGWRRSQNKLKGG